MGQLALLLLNGLLVLLNAGPMYWQLLQGNSGPISMGIWVMVINLNDFVCLSVSINVQRLDKADNPTELDWDLSLVQ